MTTYAEPRTAQQATAARAVLALVTEFPELPAANIDLAPYTDGERLRVHMHRNPAGFERWREALGLDPQRADSHRFTDFQTIELRGSYQGVDLLLIGYLPLPAESAPADTAA